MVQLFAVISRIQLFEPIPSVTLGNHQWREAASLFIKRGVIMMIDGYVLFSREKILSDNDLIITINIIIS
jgi:hypothetical protein